MTDSGNLNLSVVTGDDSQRMGNGVHLELFPTPT